LPLTGILQILDSSLKETAMQYGKVALVITKQMDIREVLDQLARTKFKATCVVQLEWDQNQFVLLSVSAFHRYSRRTGERLCN
jgi:hypothetical protein